MGQYAKPYWNYIPTIAWFKSEISPGAVDSGGSIMCNDGWRCGKAGLMLTVPIHSIHALLQEQGTWHPPPLWPTHRFQSGQLPPAVRQVAGPGNTLTALATNHVAPSPRIPGQGPREQLELALHPPPRRCPPTLRHPPWLGLNPGGAELTQLASAKPKPVIYKTVMEF